MSNLWSIIGSIISKFLEHYSKELWVILKAYMHKPTKQYQRAVGSFLNDEMGAPHSQMYLMVWPT